MAFAFDCDKQTQKNTSLFGPLLMLSAAFLFTVMSVLVKLMPSQYSVWHLVFIRCCGGMIVLLAVFGRKRNPFKGRDILLLIIRGCTGSLAILTSVAALRILPISTQIVIFYSFPVFAAFFSFIIYKERVSIFQLVCIALVLTGVAVLFDFKLTGNIYGQVMAVIGGMFSGLTVTLIRSLRQKNGPVIIYLYFCVIGTLVTVPKIILDPIIPSGLIEWAMILGIILTAVVAQLLMNQGFFYCKSWEGGVYMSSETVFTSVVGITLLNDPVSWRFYTGAVLVLGSGIALNWPKTKERSGS